MCQFQRGKDKLSRFPLFRPKQALDGFVEISQYTIIRFDPFAAATITAFLNQFAQSWLKWLIGLANRKQLNRKNTKIKTQAILPTKIRFSQ